MLLLKAACPVGVADEVAKALLARPETGRVTRIRAAEAAGDLDLVQTEIMDAAVDDVMALLAAIDGWGDGDVTLTQVGASERYGFARGRAVSITESDESIGIHQIRTMLRHLVKVDYHYVLLMTMAAIIASIGLIADLPIAIIGAMAFSPDLGTLNAMGFAILIRDAGLGLRGLRSLALGMIVVIFSAAVGTLFLIAISAVDDPLSGIDDRLVDFVSVVDGFTIAVAIASGVAAMVVFIAERGTAAVGVGVSITTIPAAAYIGIALSQGTWSAAWNGSQVLIVNILCVVGAEVLTGTLLRNRVNLRVSRPIQSRSA